METVVDTNLRSCQELPVALRAVELLALFSTTYKAEQLAEALGLSEKTLHRRLGALLRYNVVNYDDVSKTYRLVLNDKQMKAVLGALEYTSLEN